MNNKKWRLRQKQLKQDILDSNNDFFKTEYYLEFEKHLLEYQAKRDNFIKNKLESLGYVVSEDSIKYEDLEFKKGDFK